METNYQDLGALLANGLTAEQKAAVLADATLTSGFCLSMGRGDVHRLNVGGVIVGVPVDQFATFEAAFNG